MHPTRTVRRPLLGGLVLAAGLCAAATFGQDPKQPALPAPPPVQIDKTGALTVPLGGVVTFDPGLDKNDVLTDFLVSREDVVQVRPDPARKNAFILTGRSTGVSQLILTVQGKPRLVYDVVVQPDLNLLRNIIKRTIPTSAVDVQPGIGQVIILSGYVTSPQDADTVLRLATNAAGGNPNAVINAVQVGGGQQVQIDVVVASVNRNMLRQRGFDFAVPGSTVTFQSIVSGLIGSQLGANPATISPAANLQLGIVPAPFFAALQALRAENIAKFLSEPRVVTQSGRAAFFRVGGQQAIIGPSSGITGPGVQLVPFGTELEVVPIVYANGTIWLEINPRITAVNQGLGITIGGTLSPGFDEQQVRTAVMLESGQTYAIGGLIQNRVDASSSKVPVLGDLPFVGVGFSRVTHQQTEQELVILVTPRLVGPMNCDQVPHRLPGRETRNPDDYELFLENILEAPRGQRKVWNGPCYNAAYKCDPTAAIFPCVGGVCTGTPRPGVGPVIGGATCGAGCGTAAGGCAPAGMPATLPPIPVTPQPGVAGNPVTPVAPPAPPVPATLPGVGETGEPSPVGLPGTPPPAIVVPLAPRN
jgi:pilus assembly protein CpaC